VVAIIVFLARPESQPPRAGQVGGADAVGRIAGKNFDGQGARDCRGRPGAGPADTGGSPPVFFSAELGPSLSHGLGMPTILARAFVRSQSIGARGLAPLPIAFLDVSHGAVICAVNVRLMSSTSAARAVSAAMTLLAARLEAWSGTGVPAAGSSNSDMPHLAL